MELDVAKRAYTAGGFQARRPDGTRVSEGSTMVGFVFRHFFFHFFFFAFLCFSLVCAYHICMIGHLSILPLFFLEVENTPRK